MSIDLRKFFRACNPAKTLNYQNASDRQYYIDFSGVRGKEIVRELQRTIDFSEEYTCQLFTGHIGCGKSTELLRLKADLERDGFHVLYFESSEMLDMGDVDASDVLLAIAHQVSVSLKSANIVSTGRYFKALFNELKHFFQMPLEMEAEFEGSIFGIGKITAKARESQTLRSQLRQFLEPQTKGLIAAINEEILTPAISKLQKQGKQGLTIIIDNLDRLDDRRLDSGKTLPEYLFVNRGEQLGQLQCHVVYTIPLALMFSNEQQALKNRLGRGNSPFILPMIPVRCKDGSDEIEGMKKLHQLILSRALPGETEVEREGAIATIFETGETLDFLCKMSGGHVRNLLGFVQSCLRKNDALPISHVSAERTIREAQDELIVSVTDEEWELLRKVAKTKEVRGDNEYQILLRSLFVFEYRTERDGRWFDVNPLLADSYKMQP